MEILELVQKYNGFECFNPMQQKAISAGLMAKSMVVSAPTASGKTVVAEIAALNTILNKRLKVVYTCPLRALAAEHSNDFRRKYSESLSIKGVLSTGELDSSGAYLGSKDIIFSTYEKLDSLLVHRAEWLSNIGLLVVDEIHSIGSDRGATLEMLITKLRFVNPHLQVLGLSATIPNAKQLSEWLGATLVESDYRPIELREGVYLDGIVEFKKSTEEINPQKDDVLAIASDTLAKGKQALVFVNTRRTSESMAKKLAELTEKSLKPGEKIVLERAAKKALNVLELPTLQCETIAALIKRGSCFHNAGLMQKQREIIEELFKGNYLKFISSTPSLSQGVNLPAFRVIIHSPYRYTGAGMQRIPVSEFKQMCGRAGRPAYDTTGEAILLSKTEMEKDDYMDYFINGEIEGADSKMSSDSSMRFHLLCAIATGFIFDLASAEKFFSATFYSHQQGGVQNIFDKINYTLEKLREMGFVETTEKRISATPLGHRAAELYLDPLSAFAIVTALKKNKTQDLSYLYIISNTSEFYPLVSAPRVKEGELWEQLQEDKNSIPANVDSEMFSGNDLLSKYWTSLMLKDWISEVRENILAEDYKVQPGILRAKLKNADWLIYSAFELAKLLLLEVHLAPLNKMRKRLQSGIKAELIPLCELRGIGRVRARRLYNAGVKGISEVKKTDVLDLGKILGKKVAVSVKQQLDAKK